MDEEVHDFATMSKGVREALINCSIKESVVVLEQIGVIPEKYEHDSTQEKLYAKMSDCVVAHIFEHLGFETKVLSERADGADVVGKSRFHGYEFVADAKVFRLSRTANNPKDFKVPSMDHWRDGAEHAMIVCPFYQYPSTSSQIYAQVLDTGVALGSFEHLLFLFNKQVKESKKTNLRALFSYPETLSKQIAHSERKQARHVINALDSAVASICNVKVEAVREFRDTLKMSVLSRRAKREKAYWESEMEIIKKMSREEAQEALIESRKIRSKIETIGAFIIQVAQGKKS